MYRVIRDYENYKVGDIIELNERRAKSEIANGNVEWYAEPKKKAEKKEEIEKKIEKRIYQNKAYKKKR